MYPVSSASSMPIRQISSSSEQSQASAATAEHRTSAHPYNAKVFDVLREQLGRNLSHAGFPGDPENRRHERKPNQYVGKAEGGTRLLLESGFPDPVPVLRVTIGEFEKTFVLPVREPRDRTKLLRQLQTMSDDDYMLFQAAATAVNADRGRHGAEAANPTEINAMFQSVLASNVGIVIDDIDLCDSDDSGEIITILDSSDTDEASDQEDNLQKRPLEQDAALSLRTYGHWQPGSAGIASSDAPQRSTEMPTIRVPVINFLSSQGIVESALDRIEQRAKRRLSADIEHAGSNATSKKLQVAGTSRSVADVGNAPHLSFIGALRKLASMGNDQGKERVRIKERVYDVSMSGWSGEDRTIPDSSGTVHFDFVRGREGQWRLTVFVIEADQTAFTKNDARTFKKSEDDDMVLHWAACIGNEALSTKKREAPSSRVFQ